MLFFAITPSLTQDVHAHGIASDASGRIHILEDVPYASSNDVDCAVVTYLRNGHQLDMDVADGDNFLEGTRRVWFDLGGTNADYCKAITVDAQERMVIAGDATTASGTTGVLARWNTGPDIDTGFNGNGKLALNSLLPFYSSNTHLNDLTTLADGSVVACGSIDTSGETHMLVLRFLADGSLDSSFNGQGWRFVNFNSSGDKSSCNRVLKLPDGHLILAGTANDTSTNQETFAAVRLNVDGTPDATFGNGGNARIDVSGPLDFPNLSDVAYDASRSRLLLGGVNNHINLDLSVSTTCAVAALSATGAVDTGFQGTGTYLFHYTDFGIVRSGGECALRRILLRDDGTMYLAGTHIDSSSDAGTYGSTETAVARIKSDASADWSFGSSGVNFYDNGKLAYPQVPDNMKILVSHTLDDAMLYLGNLVLLQDSNRYPAGSYDSSGSGPTSHNAGPIVPVLAGVDADHLFDDGFEFDGLDEPTTTFASIAVPAGYGHYCSVRDPVSGGFGLLAGDVNADPCQTFLNQNPSLIVDRAGLWSQSGLNYAMASCSNGAIGLEVGYGADPINRIANDVGSYSGCTFTIAPASLPVFSRPYSGAHPDGTTIPNYNQSFDHDPFRIPLDVTQFGQMPLTAGCGTAITIDVYGAQQSCGSNVYLHGIDEPATDLPFAAGRTNLAVASGRVAEAVPRYVLAATPFAGDPYQREVWVRERIGDGRYSEEFVNFWAHSANTQVRRGQIVSAGTPLGDMGETGAAGGIHLHFATFRMKNLAWRAFYNMDWRVSSFTIDKEVSAMDAWGWQAPAGVDPMGWRNSGRDPSQPLYNPWSGNQIFDAGTWDINLWLPGEEPPIPHT